MIYKEYTDIIKNDIKQKKNYTDIARKIYIKYPTFAFQDKIEMEYEIANAISQYFKIPLFCIQFTGSAKTGYSYFKEKEFILAKSDLDVSIINADMFLEYTEYVCETTDGFRDLTKFISKKMNNNTMYSNYIGYISRGIFRPDLMPMSFLKQSWFNFFNELSSKYSDIFKSVNAGIYASIKCYEIKQKENIEKIESDMGGI